ncbi:MAG: hypothetical protein MRY83_12660, partial [Flavobacteriales bacterium]|nr:hypothetical protein [Flavobacteriales bacterium]
IYSEKLYTTFYHRKKIGSRDYIRQIDSLIDLSSPFVKPFLMERKARVYYAKQENVEAYELLIEASKIADSVGQNFQNIKILLGLSAISKRMESFNDAKNFALSAIKLAKSMGFGRLHKASLRQLSNSYLALGDFENAEIIIKDLI